MFCLLLGLGLYGIFHYGRPKYKEEKEEAMKYYLKYGIRLKGIIIDRKPVETGILTSNYFTYTVKISACNVAEHDIREYNENYYLVIKHDTARLVSQVHFSGNIGDTLMVDYVKGRQYIRSGSSKPCEDDLPVFDLGYNSMRKKALGW